MRSKATFLVILLLACGQLAVAQDSQQPGFATIFDKSETMIPARDGAKLHTEIYTPKKSGEALPIIFVRTPYGISAADRGFTSMLSRYVDMIPEGYIFVFQDIRGRYGSQGKFVMNRPIQDPEDPKGVDESTDAYDSIDWLVKNVKHNNGRVGMDGISYDGFLVTMALIHPHPALKAVSEQACMGDTFLGDDFFHNGAFRLSYGFEYAALMETSNENFRFSYDRFDLYDWFLRLGPLSNANTRYFHGAIPSWNEFIAHNNYDDFWKKHAVAYGLKETTVPNLNVAGWWDQEDFYGPMATYANLEKSDAGNLNYLVVGPWNHGGWGQGSGNMLGQIPFGSDTGVYFRQRVEAPWFAYWLKDKGTIPLKEALLFQTGSNIWTAFDAWPPKQAQTRNLYFREDGVLSFEAPQSDSADAFDSYISDPAHPVPYRHRPVDSTYPSDHPGSWYAWLVQDQRFVDERPDVLTWQTGELQQDLTVVGDVIAKLFASTTGTDSDWIVKLIDVYPEKYEPDWKLSGFEFDDFRRNLSWALPHLDGKTSTSTTQRDHALHHRLAHHQSHVQTRSSYYGAGAKHLVPALRS